MTDYILCVLEFLIVAAVSALFIPLYFLDATKQFAANILKTIFSYFVKILVTVMTIFLVITLYINMGVYMTTLDLSSITSILYYIFTCFIGVILVKNSGKVASAVVSGNPNLGIGDVVNEMRSIGHMAHMANRQAESFKRDVQNVASKGKAAAGGMADMNATRRAVRDGTANVEAATLENLQSMPGNTMTGEQMSAAAKAAGKEYSKKARAEAGRDYMFKMATGRDRGELYGTGGKAGYAAGQTYIDANGDERKNNAVKMKERADADAVEFANKWTNNMKGVHQNKEDHDLLNNQRFPEAKNDR